MRGWKTRGTYSLISLYCFTPILICPDMSYRFAPNISYCYPCLPLAPTIIVVVPCFMRPSARLSIANDDLNYRSNPFKDLIYRPEIWWTSVQYHEPDRYSNWPCSANFGAFYELLFFVYVSLKSTGRRCCRSLTVFFSLNSYLYSLNSLFA